MKELIITFSLNSFSSPTWALVTVASPVEILGHVEIPFLEPFEGDVVLGTQSIIMSHIETLKIPNTLKYLKHFRSEITSTQNFTPSSNFFVLEIAKTFCQFFYLGRKESNYKYIFPSGWRKKKGRGILGRLAESRSSCCKNRRRKGEEKKPTKKQRETDRSLSWCFFLSVSRFVVQVGVIHFTTLWANFPLSLSSLSPFFLLPWGFCISKLRLYPCRVVTVIATWRFLFVLSISVACYYWISVWYIYRKWNYREARILLTGGFSEQDTNHQASILAK